MADNTAEVQLDAEISTVDNTVGGGGYRGPRENPRPWNLISVSSGTNKCLFPNNKTN